MLISLTRIQRRGESAFCLRNRLNEMALTRANETGFDRDRQAPDGLFIHFRLSARICRGKGGYRSVGSFWDNRRVCHFFF